MSWCLRGATYKYSDSESVELIANDTVRVAVGLRPESRSQAKFPHTTLRGGRLRTTAGSSLFITRRFQPEPAHRQCDITEIHFPEVASEGYIIMLKRPPVSRRRSDVFTYDASRARINRRTRDEPFSAFHLAEFPGRKGSFSQGRRWSCLVQPDFNEEPRVTPRRRPPRTHAT